MRQKGDKIIITETVKPDSKRIASGIVLWNDKKGLSWHVAIRYSRVEYQRGNVK